MLTFWPFLKKNVPYILCSDTFPGRLGPAAHSTPVREERSNHGSYPSILLKSLIQIASKFAQFAHLQQKPF